MPESERPELRCAECGHPFKEARDPEKRSIKCPACIALMALKYGVRLD